MMADLPVCPGCGVQAVLHGGPEPWLETAHKFGCEWMTDMDSEPYDDQPTFRVHDDP